MSFTLMYHNKNGIPKPIKMSIWDAFKGAPTPKPAMPQSCSCCDKFHPQKRSAKKKKEKTEAKDNCEKECAKDGKDGDLVGTKSDGSDNKQDRTFSTRDQETYSKDDDKKIIEMKQKGGTWKEILDAIGKESKSQIQAHWKTIDPSKTKDSAQTAGDKPDESSKKDKTKGKAQDKKEEPKNLNSEGKSKKQQQKEANKKNADSGMKNSAETTTSSDEMKNWSDRYDKQKWIAAASRHFDLTGQRITPAIAKKLADGK